MAGFKTLERLGCFSAGKSSLLYSCYLPSGWGIRQFQGSKDFELFFLACSLRHLGISEIIIMIIWAYLI